uniref:Uncharacterized protein n=1 Tax=Arundo donax TaxID=35708 RepID=A0A0A9CDD7_ARUDO
MHGHLGQLTRTVEQQLCLSLLKGYLSYKRRDGDLDGLSSCVIGMPKSTD